jgi:stearoyl-CoA desaturase (delta-9 desaturase)
MAPNISFPTGVLHETDDEISAIDTPAEVTKPDDRKLKLVWRNIILFAYLHLAALYGLWLMFTSAKLATSAYGKFCTILNQSKYFVDRVRSRRIKFSKPTTLH